VREGIALFVRCVVDGGVDGAIERKSDLTKMHSSFKAALMLWDRPILGIRRNQDVRKSQQNASRTRWDEMGRDVELL
jgi:hypothetical protein